MAHDFQRLKVLVCDDNRAMRSLVCTFLHGFGVKDMREASNAEQAYEEYVGYEPDLVITDWNMAGTNGLDFVSQIRNNPESPNPYVPIILLTGYTELYRVSQARDRGINFYLAKPVSASALYKRLMAVVNDERPFVRSRSFFGPCRRALKRMETDYGGAERRKHPPMARSAR